MPLTGWNDDKGVGFTDKLLVFKFYVTGAIPEQDQLVIVDDAQWSGEMCRAFAVGSMRLDGIIPGWWS